MKRGGQKAKGNAYERVVAKIFTETYYPAEDGEFRRVPLSGGWDKRAAPGDLIALKYVDKEGEEMVIDRSFPFLVECKTWKDENVKHFFSGLYSEDSIFFDWMLQACGDSSLARRLPLVVFKLYRTENVAMIVSTDFYQLANLFGNFVGKIYNIEKIMPKDEGAVPQKLVFVLLKDFLEWIDWEVYKLSNKVRSIKSLTDEVKE